MRVWDIWCHFRKAFEISDDKTHGAYGSKFHDAKRFWLRRYFNLTDLMLTRVYYTAYLRQKGIMASSMALWHLITTFTTAVDENVTMAGPAAERWRKGLMCFEVKSLCHRTAPLHPYCANARRCSATPAISFHAFWSALLRSLPEWPQTSNATYNPGVLNCPNTSRKLIHYLYETSHGSSGT